MRIDLPARIVKRGVYVMPYAGPNGEMVLVAIDRRGRRVGDPIEVTADGNLSENLTKAGDALWDRLDAAD